MVKTKRFHCNIEGCDDNGRRGFKKKGDLERHVAMMHKGELEEGKERRYLDRVKRASTRKRKRKDQEEAIKFKYKQDEKTLRIIDKKLGEADRKRLKSQIKFYVADEMAKCQSKIKEELEAQKRKAKMEECFNTGEALFEQIRKFNAYKEKEMKEEVEKESLKRLNEDEKDFIIRSILIKRLLDKRLKFQEKMLGRKRYKGKVDEKKLLINYMRGESMKKKCMFCGKEEERLLRHQFKYPCSPLVDRLKKIYTNENDTNKRIDKLKRVISTLYSLDRVLSRFRKQIADMVVATLSGKQEAEEHEIKAILNSTYKLIVKSKKLKAQMIENKPLQRRRYKLLSRNEIIDELEKRKEWKKAMKEAFQEVKKEIDRISAEIDKKKESGELEKEYNDDDDNNEKSEKKYKIDEDFAINRIKKFLVEDKNKTEDLSTGATTAEKILAKTIKSIKSRDEEAIKASIIRLQRMKEEEEDEADESRYHNNEFMIFQSVKYLKEKIYDSEEEEIENLLKAYDHYKNNPSLNWRVMLVVNDNKMLNLLYGKLDFLPTHIQKYHFLKLIYNEDNIVKAFKAYYFGEKEPINALIKKVYCEYMMVVKQEIAEQRYIDCLKRDIEELYGKGASKNRIISPITPWLIAEAKLQRAVIQIRNGENPIKRIFKKEERIEEKDLSDKEIIELRRKVESYLQSLRRYTNKNKKEFIQLCRYLINLLMANEKKLALKDAEDVYEKIERLQALRLKNELLKNELKEHKYQIKYEYTFPFLFDNNEREEFYCDDNFEDVVDLPDDLVVNAYIKDELRGLLENAFEVNLGSSRNKPVYSFS